MSLETILNENFLNFTPRKIFFDDVTGKSRDKTSGSYIRIIQA